MVSCFPLWTEHVNDAMYIPSASVSSVSSSPLNSHYPLHCCFLQYSTRYCYKYILYEKTGSYMHF